MSRALELPQHADIAYRHLEIGVLLEAPGGALYAGTYGGGICRSADRGVHWVPVNTGLTRLQVWSLAATHADTIFAGTYQGGVFRSVDAGASWTNTSNGLGSASALDVRSLVVHPSGRLLAGTYDYVYRSADAGDSWTPARTGLGNTYCWTLAVRTDGLLAVGTPNGCWLSSDGGDLWTASGLSVNTSVLSLDARPNGELFAGCGSGVWWSGNGGLDKRRLGCHQQPTGRQRQPEGKDTALGQHNHPHS